MTQNQKNELLKYMDENPDMDWEFERKLIEEQEIDE